MSKRMRNEGPIPPPFCCNCYVHRHYCLWIEYYRKSVIPSVIGERIIVFSHFEAQFLLFFLICVLLMCILFDAGR